MKTNKTQRKGLASLLLFSSLMFGVSPIFASAETIIQTQPDHELIKQTINGFNYHLERGETHIKFSISDDKVNVAHFFDHIVFTNEGAFGVIDNDRYLISDVALNFNFANARAFRIENSELTTVSHYTDDTSLTLTSANLENIIIIEKQQTPFKDTENSPFKQSIETLYSYGITQGTTKTTFSPNSLVTRAQYAVMLTRVLELPKISYSSYSLTDLPNKWYANQVQSIANLDIISGHTDKTFKGEDHLTQQHALNITAKVLKQLQVTDSTIDQLVLLATETMVNPNSPITRGELVYLLLTAIQLSNKY